MYWTLRLTAFVFLLLCGLTRPALADLASEQYVVAAHHYSQGRWPLAVEEFTAFLQAHGDHERADSVLFFLAESLVQVGQFPAAHDRYAEYLRRCPDGKYAQQGQFRVGETLYLDGQHQQAREHLRRFVQQHPDDPLCGYAWPYLGEIALVAGESREAREAFEQGLQQFPQGPLAQECRFGLARALESLGDSDGAIRFYEFLGGSDQRSAISDDALLQMAILLYQQRRYEEAIAALEQHRQRYPGSELAAHNAYWLGLNQMALGRLSAAAATLSAAAERFPDHQLAAAMFFSAGEAYRQMQDPAAARDSYQRVITQYADSTWVDDSLQTLVQAAWEEGDHAKVLELAQRFVEQHAASPLASHVRQTAARACLKRAEYEAAITWLEPCLQSDAHDEGKDAPSPPQPHEAPLPSQIGQPGTQSASMAATRYYLALALLGSKRYDEALAHLDTLADVDQPRELASGVHAARAATLLGLERYDEAITSLHLYLAAEPNGPDAEKCRAQLAVACARRERWSEVRRVFTQMQQRHDDLQLYLSSVAYMAEAAYARDQRDLAGDLYREMSRDGNPEDYLARGLSGLAWLEWTQQGHSADSARKFEQLLTRFPDSPLAAEAAMMRGQSLEQVGKAEGALAMYHLVLNRYASSPHVAAAMLAAARIHDALQQDSQAEPLLRRWLADHPQSPQRPDALYQLAWVLVDLEREEEADQVFQQIYTQCSASRYWSDATYRLAERAARSQDHDRANALASEIVDRASEPQMVAYALYLRGQLAVAEERWQDAAAPLRQLLNDHPDSPHRLAAEYWLAESYFRQRQYEEAGALFDQLEQRTRNHTEAWVAMIPLRRAQVLAHRQQWAEVFEVASQIAARFPQFSQQHEVDYVLGRYHASRAEFELAREAYLRVIRSETGRATETAAVAQWMIGETYFMQRQYNQAIKEYYRVEAMYDFPRWKAAALLQAGKCYEMVGRWSEAAELYAKVVQDYAHTLFADKAANRLQVAQQRAALMHTR